MQKNKQSYIQITGAKVHNLKGASVKIPRNSLTVITGVSGSGKSSLAFDTLYAEGQRRYVESLSSYARQFLGRLEKPDVESITGLSPAIAIEQKVISKSSRSTIATTTEIFEYLKLLFARIGKTYSPISGNEVKSHSVEDVVNAITTFDDTFSFGILAALPTDKKLEDHLKILIQQGFSRVYIIDQGYKRIEDLAEENLKDIAISQVLLAIDRLSFDGLDEFDRSRAVDGINTAFYEGNGSCTILFEREDGSKTTQNFSNKFELDGIVFEKPNEAFFSFNNPYGACKSCEGFGSIIGIDPDLVIPDSSLSVYNDAVVCWKGEKMSEWKDQFIAKASETGFPIHKAIDDLSPEDLKILWNGAKGCKGINAFFKYLEQKSYKIQYRVMLSRYRGKTACTECEGSRIRKDAHYVKINEHSISDILKMTIGKAQQFFNTIQLSEFEFKVADRLLIEIKARLSFLMDVGLNYLSLDRLSNTLSGGESQRINLATSLGSSLVGSTYILDEPSIGLHPKDTLNLIRVLKNLRNQGNTVVVVEHDEEIMRQSDYLIDMGPLAGSNGGEVCFQGDLTQILKADTLTGNYLNKQLSLPSIKHPLLVKEFIEIHQAKEHNLKGIDVKFPVNSFSVLVGVSGSGKSTLIKDILYPALSQKLGLGGSKPGKHKEIKYPSKKITSVEYVDQNPIGKSSRSNPVTYVKAFDEIRNLYAGLAQAKKEGLKPAHFSFNVSGGRCDECEGEGSIKIEMQFMADVHLNCESCNGKRYKEEILDIKFEGLSIADILDSTIDDAVAFFTTHAKKRACQKIIDKLTPLQQVGLGYLKLGQSSNTLSGGEAQRIKLASFIAKGNAKDQILFLFDEPTTGLHFYDIQNLLDSFQLLLEAGHSIICIEHNVDLIKAANWLVEIGPEGGDKGGELLYQGPLADAKKDKQSLMAGFMG